MYSVQMVLEQARARVRMAHDGERQEASLILAAYTQLVDAHPAIERLQRMEEELRQDPNRTAAA